MQELLSMLVLACPPDRFCEHCCNGHNHLVSIDNMSFLPSNLKMYGETYKYEHSDTSSSMCFQVCDVKGCVANA